MQKQVDIELKFIELKTLKEYRLQRLSESEKFYKFIRQADEVIEWIGDQTTIAASEDYGCDVEHVELLIQIFDNFLAGLARTCIREERILAVLDEGQRLIEQNNPEKNKILQKIDETKQQWDDLKELAHARQDALAGAKQVHMFDKTADETISWIQEKEAALSSDDYGQDLEASQALVRKHQGFETDLAAVKEQVESLMEEASRLIELFPDARVHINVKHQEAEAAWAELLEQAAQRRSKLAQAEQLQAYLGEYRELISWINEMVAKVTAPELARDVPGADALLSRHNEYKSEIDTREEAFEKFYRTGQELIEQGNFLAKEIEDKISVLQQRQQILKDTWRQRRYIYEQNLDTQLFKRDAETLENWIVNREPMLHDEKLGDSISQVEELIRKHEDFEKTIQAQEERFSALKRITMLEEAFQKQQEAEMAARQAEKERVERAKIEERKRKEVQRITEERKREEERRRLLDNSHRAQHDELNGSVDEHESANMLSPLKGATASETIEPATSQKPFGLSHMLGERLRRATSDIKRAESMKVDTKKPKRTPSFTTRRRTQSFRRLQRMENMDALRPVEIQGLLERKHELQSSGKKAAVRSWKQYYTVLCGQLLCFFKDIEDFNLSKAATAPITIFNAICEKADDYTKKKNVFRLKCTDGSEFLFLAPSQEEMEDWVNKISFHAKLPPSLQLLSYDDSQKMQQESLQRLQSSRLEHTDDNASTGSSRASTPEMERKNSVIRRDPTSPNQHSPSSVQIEFLQMHRHNQQRRNDMQNAEAFLTSQRSEPQTQTQTEFLQMHRQQQLLAQQQQLIQQEQLAAQRDQYQQNSDKPPIPPRGAPPPVPMRTPSSENMMQYRRNDVEHHLPQGRPNVYQRSATLNHNGSGQYPTNEPVWHRQSSVDLPPQHQAYGNVPNIRQGVQQQNSTFTGRPTSLPPYVAPPAAPQTSPPNIVVMDNRRASESGSESEQSSGSNRKGRDYKRSSVLSNLFGRYKKPSQS